MRAAPREAHVPHMHSARRFAPNGRCKEMSTVATAKISSPVRALVTTQADVDSGDEVLVRAAQDGDRSAFGVLYQRYIRMVHGILLAKVPYHAAEDLVHDVFLSALPRLSSLRDASRFGPWLAAIARNRSSDFHRHAKSQPVLDSGSDATEAADCTGSSLGAEDSMALLNALRELPEAYREPLILRFVEGMTGPEIATRTGLTHGSVRVNLHRGMQMLREKWQRGNHPAENEKES
jgi:RNA polymerase sigma-70 factor (ECF subfamily)